MNRTRLVQHPTEMAGFVLLLAILNLPFLNHGSELALFPGAMERGEGWRWLTFCWAHVSFYHLLLDATAFLSLYDAQRCGVRRRWQHLAFCLAGSGLAPVLTDPRLSELGLRGLSGVAHGLMVIVSLEAMTRRDKRARTLGTLMFAGVIGKCALEQWTGSVLFSSWHLGNVGLPVPACHVGGALGALLSAALVRFRIWERRTEARGYIKPRLQRWSLMSSSKAWR